MTSASPFVAGCALLDLGGRSGVLRARGTDAASYLQRQVSGDLRKITSSRGIRSTLMTRKGKLVAFFEIHSDAAGGFVIAGDEPGISALHAALAKLVILEDVMLTTGDEAGALLSVQGPEAAAVLARALSVERPPEEDLEQATLPCGHAGVVLARRRRSFASGWDLLMPASAKEEIRHRVLGAGAAAVGDDAIEAARIDAGIPRFGIDADGDTLPPECGYDDAVSYDKGCYVGQEIVARIRTYGHVNRLLCRMNFEEAAPPPRGASVAVGGVESGNITSSAVSPRTGRAVALGYLRHGHVQPGARVTVQVDAACWNGLLSVIE